MRAWLLATALVSVTTVAHAQDREALRWLREGVRLRVERRDADALAAFERAWERCRCDEALGQRAVAEQALGRWGEAAEWMDALEGSTDAWVARHRDALAAARGVIARHVGTVALRVDAEGAAVFIEGRARGGVEGGARRLRVDAGEVELRVEAAGRTVRRRVRVEAGAEVAVEVALAEPPPVVAETEVRAPAVVTAVRAPEVAVGVAAEPVVATTRRSRAPWVWGVGALGVAASAGGAVALAVRNEAVSRYNDPACTTVFASREENCGALRRAAEVDEALAVTGFVVGGVAAVVATVLAATGRRGAAARAWACGPTGVAAVTCGVAF